MYQKSWWFDLQFLRYRVWRCSWDILRMCIKSHNHMSYSFWNTDWDRETFLSFWATFCPFTALTTPKIELLKKMKKKNTRRYHHFTLGHHKLWSYYVWFLRYGAWQTEFFLMFWSSFALLPQENQNFEMMKEVSGDIIISHMCTKNYDQIMFNTWDMVHDKQTDRWTDWLMEKVTQRGGCPT